MTTFYTKIDDQFDGSSLDLNVWGDAPYSTGVTLAGGHAVMTTTGQFNGDGQLNANYIALDGTPEMLAPDGTSVVFETKVRLDGQRGPTGNVYARALHVQLYNFVNSVQYMAGFQLYTSTGSGSSTVYDMITEAQVGSGESTGSSVTNIGDGVWVWLRITVDGATGGVKWEYSLNGTSWVTARQMTSRHFPNTADVNLVAYYETYSATGPAASVHFDYITVKNTEPPVVDGTATPMSGHAPLTVQFTDTSPGVFTSWLWDFGDGSTSTSQNPSHTYTSPGKYTVSLTATDRVGTNTATRQNFISVPAVLTQGSTISRTPTVGTPTIIQHAPPPPPPTDWTAVGKEDEKEYVYKVYKSDGTYIGVWNDVKDSLQFTQQINTPGTTTTVRLARSADTVKEFRDNLVDDGLDGITTQDGDSLIVTYENSNTVGEGTDVDLNYKVDVYVHYGEFTDLTTQDGIDLTTQDDEVLNVASGAPLGTPVFRGFILDYESAYGDEDGVTVTLSSNGYELSNELIRSGEVTTVNYSTTAVESIVKSILDTNPGAMSYNTASIDAVGVSTTMKFQLNTKLEGIQSAFEQTPDGFYWYGNVAENLLYMKQRSSTPDHIFIRGTHIKSISVKRTLEGLINTVYFVGGETTQGDPSTTVYKKYQDTPSQSTWRRGLDRITDRRYTLATSMANRANREIAGHKDPVYTTPVTISSGRYDIESIKIGQMVGFRNFGNFVDGLVLQIVSISYTPTAVTLQLGDIPARQVDMLSNIEQGLNNEQFDALPIQPT